MGLTIIPPDLRESSRRPVNSLATKVPTFITLLRGINVGKAKRVPMAELRALLAGLGYGDVQTLLNSGNAVFTHANANTAAHAEAIAQALRTHFGFDIPVIVKSATDIAAIAAQNPLAAPGVDPSRLLVILALAASPPQAVHALAACVQAPDPFAVGKHAAYLHCPGGILSSPAAERALRGLGEVITTRNWATTLKLLALAVPGGT